LKGSRRLELSKEFVKAFLQLCNLTRDCGYGELDVALWQSALDLILNPLDEQVNLQLFSEFWQDEGARLGESINATWQGNREELPAEEFQAEELKPTKNVMKRFVVLERRMENELWVSLNFCPFDPLDRKKSVFAQQLLWAPYSALASMRYPLAHPSSTFLSICADKLIAARSNSGQHSIRRLFPHRSFPRFRAYSINSSCEKSGKWSRH
jgi:hypothetical protein